MKEEFEVEQQVTVSNESIEAALKIANDADHLYYYLVTLSNGAIAVRVVNPNGSDYVECFNYVTAMPDAPIVTMFTHETFPRGLVYVREKYSPVLVVMGTIIATSSGVHTYARLAEALEMSLDNGKSWVPCGELK